MTVKEKIFQRIEQMDETDLPALLREIEDFERRMKSDFPSEFLDTVTRIHERNEDLSPDDAARLADDAVEWARRTRKR